MSGIRSFVLVSFAVLLLAAPALGGEQDQASLDEDVQKKALDLLIDRATAAKGEERNRCVRALTALGEVAVRRLLERAENPQDHPPRPAILIECRLLEADAGVLEKLLGEQRPTSKSPHHAIGAILAQSILAHAGKDLRVLHAPRLTTFDGQSANVTLTNQVSYVRDYAVKKDDEGNVILDPVVAVIKDGLVIDLDPRLEGDRIALNVRITLADLARPIPETEVQYEGTSARIQVPELRVSRVRAELDLAEGGYALVGGFSSTDERERILILKVERVEVTPR